MTEKNTTLELVNEKPKEKKKRKPRQKKNYDDKIMTLHEQIEFMENEKKYLNREEFLELELFYNKRSNVEKELQSIPLKIKNNAYIIKDLERQIEAIKQENIRLQTHAKNMSSNKEELLQEYKSYAKKIVKKYKLSEDDFSYDDETYEIFENINEVK